MSGLHVRELTAPGRGAVSVLELRGAGALGQVQGLCPGVRLAPGRVTLARLEERGEALDEALVVVHADDLVELHLHGSPALVQALRARLRGTEGAPGPATLEERAAQLAVRAASESGARILLDQAEGALRQELRRIAAAAPGEQDRRLDALLARAHAVRHALEPALVLLLGPTNAGKSTLFNALVGQDRALVSGEVGTTRDVVVERARLGAYPVDLADGPGDRARPPAPADRGAGLEREGGRLGRALAQRAALVAWLSPAARPVRPPADLPCGRTLALATQADDPGAPVPGPALEAISALRRPAQAAEVVARAFRRVLDLPEEPWCPGAPELFEPPLVALAGRARASTGPARARLLDRLATSCDPGTEHGS